MSTMAGVGQVARMSVRRDRVLVSAWTLVLVGVCYASAAATASLYPSAADRVAAAGAINASPAVVALYGPILDVRSLGEVAMTKMTVLYAVFVAILAVVVVRRHTRAEEESGRAELLAGTAIGRDALLAAAVTEGAAVSLAVGVLAAVADVLGGLPVEGSLAFGASWAGLGLVATGLSAAACQVSASSRTCGAVAAAALAAFFLLRVVGDTTSWSGLSWLSPFGWGTQLRAWSAPRWWVLLLYVATAVVLVALAHVLRSRRDLGSGLVAPRPGPATGSPRLADAVALAIRLHGPTVLTWTAGMTVLGLVMGAIAPNIGDLLDSPGARELVQRLGGVGAIQDTLLAVELSIMAVVITCFAVAVVGHGAADEHDGRTEQVLATATSRARSYAAVLVVALVGSAWLLLVTGLAVTVGFGGASGDLGDAFGRVLPAALVQAPAVWLVTGGAVAAYAWRSGWAAAGWVLVVACLTVGQFGELLSLPRWVIDLSPYVHVPRMPVDAFSATPTLVMTLLAVALLALGWLGYRARDIG
jgi:ABC-2 type transport system permease protein